MRQIFSPLDGFRSPFGRLMGSTAPFTPAVLFGASEPGVWYDPSDLTTLFQDTAGTTPVTTPGQTVALALDKSKGLVLGSELVTNGTFDSGITAWTKVAGTTNPLSWDSVGQRLVVTNDLAYFAGATQTLSGLVAGRSYQLTANISGNTVTALAQIQFLSGAASLAINPGGGVARFIFTATSTSHTLQVGHSQSTLGGLSYWDNISVKELPGFHATQATLASRPTYGIVPLGGRRNLLTFTEQFDNAVWDKQVSATVTANAGVAPDGTSTADRVTFGGSFSNVRQLIPISSGINVVSSVWVKLESGNANLTIGASGSTATASITVTSDWQRFSVTALTAAATNYGVMLQDRNGSGYGSVLIWGAQLETGSSATAYQRVGSAFDVTEAGVASLSYLSFDGIDDHLVTPTVNFSTDKMTVFAGVRKLSDAAFAMVAETGTGLQNGSIFLAAPGGAAANYRLLSRGTTNGDAIGTTFAAPITNVLTGLGDISGDLATLRVNGTQAAQSTADQGTGNYLAYPLYIGRRAGTSLPFNGQLFSLIVRNAATDAATITSSETWVAGKTGVTL